MHSSAESPCKHPLLCLAPFADEPFPLELVDSWLLHVKKDLNPAATAASVAGIASLEDDVVGHDDHGSDYALTAAADQGLVQVESDDLAPSMSWRSDGFVKHDLAAPHMLGNALRLEWAPSPNVHELLVAGRRAS